MSSLSTVVPVLFTRRERVHARLPRVCPAAALLLAVVIHAAADEMPLPTRWKDPLGRPRPSHCVPREDDRFIMRMESLLPGRLIQEKAQEAPVPPAGSGRICLVVADPVYNAVSNKLARHARNLQADGYTVATCRFTSGSAADLRAYLQGLYGEPQSLAGAEFIGDLPHIIYEMMQDWGSGAEYEDFPCDMFFMDLNGTWSDTLETGSVHAANGKYDTWTGDGNLEIWVSRLKTSNLTDLGSESAVLNTYLDKNHFYRQRVLCPTWAGLVYNDDDWYYMGTDDRTNIEGIYGSGFVSMVTNVEGTSAADYKTSRLPVSQEIVLTRSHGYSGGHGYYRSGKSIFDYVYPADYRAIDPPALFYSLFVCSGSDYTAANNVAGIAAFNEKSGLLSWGSTKTGGMWAETPFWQSVNNGMCFGKAFVAWFNQVKSWYPSYAPPWWYGMVLIGDASLRPSTETFLLTLSLPPGVSEGAGNMAAGGVVSIPWALETNLTVSLASTDTTELAVPSSVTITAGQTSATFDLAVIDDTAKDGVQAVTVIATASQWVRSSAAIQVTDDELTLQVISSRGGAYPGTLTTNSSAMLSQWVTNSPQSGGAGTQYVCTGWTMSGNMPVSGSGTNAVLVLTNGATLTWIWQARYWLDTEAGPNGSVDQADQWVAAGSNLTITGTADDYYHFGAWCGDTNGCGITGSRITVPMAGPCALQASFRETVSASNTPHWWLAQYQLPTNDAGAFYDEGDGVPGWQEYEADTDPTNSDSVLALIGVRREAGGMRLEWKGGRQAAQYIQRGTELGSTGAVWTSFHTNNVLPTSITNMAIDTRATNGVLFYRIKAERY